MSQTEPTHQKPKTIVVAIRFKPSQLGLALDGLTKNFPTGEYDTLSKIVKNTFLHGLNSFNNNDKEITEKSKQKLKEISTLIDW